MGVPPKLKIGSPCAEFICVQLICTQLFATPWTVARQAPLSMGILQARILEGVAMPSSRGSSRPRSQTQVSCIAGRFFTDLKECESAFRLPHPPLRISGPHCSPGHPLGIILPSSVETQAQPGSLTAQVLTEQRPSAAGFPGEPHQASSSSLCP